MNPTVKLAVFGLVALAQLAAPAWMIGRREWVLEHGTVYKFKTAPVDPYDPFRGRYVWLAVEQNTAPYIGQGPPPYGKDVYAVLEVGEDGFARFSGVDLRPPAAGDYIRAHGDYAGEGMILLRVPFDRYYMNERKAPEAELAYREHSTGEQRDAYVTVRVLDGYAVLEQLYISGAPIEEFLASTKESAPPQ